MKKNKLKNGMILKNRKGYKMLLVGDKLIGDDGYSPLSNYDDDLKNIVNSDFDIMKVYNYIIPFGFNRILEDDNLELLWERKEIKLTDREIEVLKALKTLGYAWLAGDKNDKLFAYEKTPVKDTFIWFCKEEHYYYPIQEKDLFNFIKWEDEEPASIDELLEMVVTK